MVRKVQSAFEKLGGQRRNKLSVFFEKAVDLAAGSITSTLLSLKFVRDTVISFIDSYNVLRALVFIRKLVAKYPVHPRVLQCAPPMERTVYKAVAFVNKVFGDKYPSYVQHAGGYTRGLDFSGSKELVESCVDISKKSLDKSDNNVVKSGVNFGVVCSESNGGDRSTKIPPVALDDVTCHQSSMVACRS